MCVFLYCFVFLPYILTQNYKRVCKAVYERKGGEKKTAMPQQGHKRNVWTCEKKKKMDMNEKTRAEDSINNTDDDSAIHDNNKEHSVQSVDDNMEDEETTTTEQ